MSSPTHNNYVGNGNDSSMMNRMGERLSPKKPSLRNRRGTESRFKIESYKMVGHVHDKITFNGKAFVQTWLMEMFPLFPLNYVIAMMYQMMKHEKVWKELANRQMRIVLGSPNHKKPVFPYPLAFVIGATPYVALFCKLALGVDTIGWVECWLAILFRFVNASSLSCKYAYYPKDEYKIVTGDGVWTNDMTNRRMLVGGWLKPGQFDGLLEGLYDDARTEALVDIYMYDFVGVTSKRGAELLVKQARSLKGFEEHEESHEVELAEEGVGRGGRGSGARLPASAVMMGVVKKCFSTRASSPSTKFLILGVCMSFVPPVGRYLHGLYGGRPFGDTSLLEASYACLLINFQLGHFAPHMWSLVLIADNKRRKRAYNMLGRMLVEPGVKVSEFLSLLEAEGEKGEKGMGLGMEAYGVSGATVAPELDVGEVGTDEYIYVDPSDRKNVMSWMICRDLVRTYGQSFMLRGEAYLSVNLLASMFILAGINVLIVGGVEHHWWDVVQLMFYMLVLTRTVVATALSVAELNELVIEHREIIRAAKVRMCGGGDGSGGGSAEDVRQSVMFLNAVDELIETREQT
ncbi:hypothetical protein TrLO_g104, partial [Triparma laevis f. longispina]